MTDSEIQVALMLCGIDSTDPGAQVARVSDIATHVHDAVANTMLQTLRAMNENAETTESDFNVFALASKVAALLLAYSTQGTMPDDVREFSAAIAMGITETQEVSHVGVRHRDQTERNGEPN